MKISLEWLNSYLSAPATADEVATLLTQQGMPIEEQQSLADGDMALEVEVTSNRSDCLSHIGVAREVVAGSDRSLVLPAIPEDVAASGGAAVESLASVTVDAPELCPIYTARVIRGVKVGPSPRWLVRRLEAVGLRSVNNVVDVSNYILLEMGQPLHTFDLARLGGRGVVVRSAHEGETFAAIDGSKHTLRSGMLVIADASRPVAIAGVMGGSESEVGPGTTDLLIESATFAPMSVRHTSRALRLSSDSSYRFERGVDPRGVELASRRAAQLIVELAGGEVARGVIRVGMPEPEPRTVEMRARRCRQILGLDLKGKEMVRLLDKLGLSPRPLKARKAIACQVPTHRLDLLREIDLIEEVGRMAGLDRVKVRKRIRIVARPAQPKLVAWSHLRRMLLAHGYHETITFSFVTPRQGQPFVPPGREAVMIDDERRKSEPMLRPSLLPSLLQCRKINQDAGNAPVRLFETAASWTRLDGKVEEHVRLGIVADAAGTPGESLRELRGAIEEVMHSLMGEGAMTIEPAESPLYDAAAAVVCGGRRLGLMGVATAEVRRLFSLETPVVMAELDLPAMLEQYPPARTVRSLPRFPAIERDLSVVVDEAVRWSDLREQIVLAQPALLDSISFLTTYRGKPVPAGRKSVSFRMLFRDPQATLRHEQVDPQVASVVSKLKDQLGAELRA